MNKVLFSKTSDNWKTPSCILSLTGNGEENTECVFATREELFRFLGEDKDE